jgi:hypothetical protein
MVTVGDRGVECRRYRAGRWDVRTEPADGVERTEVRVVWCSWNTGELGGRIWNDVGVEVGGDGSGGSGCTVPDGVDGGELRGYDGGG